MSAADGDRAGCHEVIEMHHPVLSTDEHRSVFLRCSCGWIPPGDDRDGDVEDAFVWHVTQVIVQTRRHTLDARETP